MRRRCNHCYAVDCDSLSPGSLVRNDKTAEGGLLREKGLSLSDRWRVNGGLVVLLDSRKAVSMTLTRLLLIFYGGNRVGGLAIVSTRC